MDGIFVKLDAALIPFLEMKILLILISVLF